MNFLSPARHTAPAQRHTHEVSDASAASLSPDPVALFTRGVLEPASSACSSTHSITTDIEVELTFLGVKLGIRVQADPVQGTYTATNTTDKTKSGCLTFTDSDGNPIGRPQNVSIPPGGSITGPLPSGATGFSISDEPCPEEEEEEGEEGGSSTSRSGNPGSGSKLKYVGKGKYTYEHVALVAGQFEVSRTFVVTVFTHSENAALAVRDHLVKHGVNRKIPRKISRQLGLGGVELHYFQESRVVGADLVLSWASDDPIQFFEAGINGTPAALKMNEGTISTVANDWEAIDFTLPLVSNPIFNYDATPGAVWTNDFDVELLQADPRYSEPVSSNGLVSFISE